MSKPARQPSFSNGSLHSVWPPRTFACSLSLALLGVGLANGCYVGIEDDGVAEFGDELGDDVGTEESGDAGEAGEADGDGASSAADGDPSTTDTGDGDGDPSTTDTGDGDGDPSTTDTGDGDGDPSTTDTTDTGDGDGDTSTTDTGDGDGDPMGDMPDNAYCNPVSNWSAQSIQLEGQVLDLVNQARAQGGNCGSQGSFPPSGPLTWEAHLTCAARVHSLDMATANFFDHTNLQGHGPDWRLDQAGYAGGAWGENIAAGYPDPNAVVQGWLDSDGHCANMLNPGFSLIGVGFAYDGGSSYGNYWTQTFGD